MIQLVARATMVLAATVLLLVFQNCSDPSHTSSDTTSQYALDKTCQEILQSAFATSYHPFLKTNCGSCHSTGPGSGFFASNDTELSFTAFLGKGEAKISEFAVSTHKTPYTGAQHEASVDGLKQTWSTAVTEYNTCRTQNADGNNSDPINPGGGPIFALPDKKLTAKTANPALNRTVNLTWNTGADFEDPSNAFAGGSFVLTVRQVSLSGTVPAYQFENLRFVNTSNTAAYVRSVAILVNDQTVDGETYLYVDRYVPNLANNNSRRLAPGAAVHAMDIPAAGIQVKLVVGLVKAAEIDFQPVTYADLTAANGIFTQNCAGCHGNSGGLSLATANYNNIVGRTANSDKVLVSPYSLLNNFLYQRMNDADSPMPQGGLLPQTLRDRVRDWILDGAPLDVQSIAR